MAKAKAKIGKKMPAREAARIYWTEMLGADLYEVRQVCLHHDPQWVQDAWTAMRHKERILGRPCADPQVFVVEFLKKRMKGLRDK